MHSACTFDAVVYVSHIASYYVEYYSACITLLMGLVRGAGQQALQDQYQYCKFSTCCLYGVSAFEGLSAQSAGEAMISSTSPPFTFRVSCTMLLVVAIGSDSIQ